MGEVAYSVGSVICNLLAYVAWAPTSCISSAGLGIIGTAVLLGGAFAALMYGLMRGGHV